MKRFFVYDPEQWFQTFDTQEEALKFAQGCIDDYLCDDEWDECVERVVCGEITHLATQAEREERPADEQLDKYGYDVDGTYWDKDLKYKCNYKPLPAAPKGDE